MTSGKKNLIDFLENKNTAYSLQKRLQDIIFQICHTSKKRSHIFIIDAFLKNYLVSAEFHFHSTACFTFDPVLLFNCLHLVC